MPEACLNHNAIKLLLVSHVRKQFPMSLKHTNAPAHRCIRVAEVAWKCSTLLQKAVFIVIPLWTKHYALWCSKDVKQMRYPVLLRINLPTQRRGREAQHARCARGYTPSKCIADEVSHNAAAWLPSGVPWSTIRVTNTIAAELPTAMCLGAPMSACRVLPAGCRPCSCRESNHTMWEGDGIRNRL